MPKRVRLSRKKGYRKPAGAVVVSRPTKWGNPFNWREIAVQPGYESQKELAKREYARWLAGNSPYRDICPEKRQWILDHIHELAGKDLACWCKLCDRHKNGKPLSEDCPNCEPCHIDPLGKLANPKEEGLHNE